MPKKEKIPPPGGKKDEFTNFYSKAKWKQFLLKSTLDVSGRNLRPTGAQIVGNTLMKNKWVTALDLCHNNIGDMGAIEIAQVMKANDTLQSVNLSCNGITDVGGIAIASAFVPCPHPAGLPSQWNRGIYYLNLSGNQLGDVSLVALANAAACHRDLTKVDVSNNLIGGIGCKAFARAMERNQMCTFLLGGNKLGDEGASHLAMAMKTFGGKGSQAVLDLNNNNISKGGAEAIGMLLENNDFVQDVNLCWNTLGYKGTEALITRILPPAMTCIRTLNLANNCLGDEGAEEVAKVIGANIPTLIRINLTHNDIGDRGGEALARACQQNTSLQFLLLAQNHIGPKSVEGFCDLIRTTQTMRAIEIRKNGLDDEQKNKISDSNSKKVCDTLRVDYMTSDEGEDSMTQFLDKLQSWLAEKAQAEEEAAAKKKGKKGKKKG